VTFPGKQAARGRHNGGMVRADRAATHRRRREQRHCDHCARPWTHMLWRRGYLRLECERHYRGMRGR